MELTYDELTTLETDYIDRVGVAATLEAVERICYEKAAHLKTNWQDDSAATCWEKAGARISIAANKVRELMGSF